MVPTQGDQNLCYVVYTVLYVFLSSVIGLCCKIDYNLETELKIMTFELCFMRCGNVFGRERECDLGMEWEWELLDGNGKERESKTHSRTPLTLTDECLCVNQAKNNSNGKLAIKSTIKVTDCLYHM